MKWKVEDAIVNWLKVRCSETGKTYFILWDVDPAFPAIGLLPVIPFNPKESTLLTVPLRAGDLPGLAADQVATSVIRDPELVKLWRRERRKLEKRGDLEPLPHAPVGEVSPPSDRGTSPVGA
jgi:hypothetical protein